MPPCSASLPRHRPHFDIHASRPTVPHRIALLGNPTLQPAWTDETVQALVDEGFTQVQLNIAWGSRPNNETRSTSTMSSPSQPIDPIVAARQPELRDIDLANMASKPSSISARRFVAKAKPRHRRNQTGKPDAFAGTPPWFDTGLRIRNRPAQSSSNNSAMSTTSWSTHTTRTPGRLRSSRPTPPPAAFRSTSGY